MKNQANPFRPAQRRAFYLPLAITLALVGGARAVDCYWDNSGGTANDWGSVDNWSDVLAGGGTGTIPTASEVATFSATPIQGTAQTVNLNADRSILGLNLLSEVTADTTLASGGAARTLTLGTSGIVNAGSGVVKIGSVAAGTAAVKVSFAGSQSIANNGIGKIIMYNAVSGTDSPTLTNNGTGTGAVEFQFPAGIDSTVSKIVQDSATSALGLRCQNPLFSGGVEVKQGILNIGNQPSNLGTGTLTLGGGGDGVTAMLRLQDNSNVTFNNPIVLGSGTLTILLNEDSPTISHNKTFTGGITGSNSLTIENNGGNDTITFSTNALNNASTITHIGTASGLGFSTISASIGENVTNLIQNSTTCKLVLSGSTSAAGNTVTVTAGTLQLGSANRLHDASALVVNGGTFNMNNFSDTVGSVSISSGAITTGTGILGIGTGGLTSTVTTDTTIAKVLLAGSQNWANNGSAKVMISGAVTGSGSPTLTNNGTGTGTVEFNFSSAINSSVSKIVQDSATSQLNLRNSNPAFTGGVEIKKGTVQIGGFDANLGSSASILTLGNSAGGADAATLEYFDDKNRTYTNPISLASTTTGALTIRLKNDGSASAYTQTFTGGITGSNSLILENGASGNDHLTFSTGALNNSGTITHIGDGTGDATINSVIGTNVTGVIQNSATSRLVLTGTNTYTGDTTVSAGTLVVDGDAIPNTGKLVIAGGKVDPSGATETVSTLFFGTVQQVAGTWGSESSTATHKTDTYFTGTGVVNVTSGPGFANWQSANSTTGDLSADHDNDGVANGVEYFLKGAANSTGFTPLSPVDAGGGTLSVTWTKAADYLGAYGTGFRVETSDTLADPWIPAAQGVGPGMVEITGNTVKFTFPAGVKLFARLVVIGP